LTATHSRLSRACIALISKLLIDKAIAVIILLVTEFRLGQDLLLAFSPSAALAAL